MKRSYLKFSLLVLLSIVLVFISACGNNSNAPAPAQPSTTTPSNETPSKTDGAEDTTGIEYSASFADGKYDPPITLTTVAGVTPATKFKNGETMEDNVHTRWAMERFGIDLEYLWTSTTQNNAFNTRLRLALSANEPMPDVIAIEDIQLTNDLIDSGKFMEVGEMWKKYASPMYKQAVNEDPTMWYPYMREDGAYGIPIPEYAMNNDSILFIRQDWLDKFGFEGPETLEDLEKIMDAFVNQDPDGNGQDDTYGLAVSLKDTLIPAQATPSWVFGAFGKIPEQWNENDDGTLSYGSVTPGAKQALAKLNEWVEKGYIHREAGLHDEAKANELFTAGRAGIIAGPYWMDRTPLDDVMANVEGATFKTYAVPAGPDGEAGRQGALSFRGAILINKDAKHPEAFFVYQNYLFENFAMMTEGSEFEYQFAEGYDYILKEDGVASYSTDDIPGGRVIPQKYTIAFEGARIPSSAMESLGWLAEGNEPRNNFERKDSLFADERRLQAASTNLKSSDLSMRQMFTGPPTSTMKSRGEYLKTQELETFIKIIYGELPIDEFDNFVANWKSAGGDDITNEVNEWYSAVKQ
jgi:putative aldouronate transport system substrate-binding protein